MDYTVRAVAYIRNERSEALDDNWDDVLSTVELAQDVPSESLRGLADFSHVEIVFLAEEVLQVSIDNEELRPFRTVGDVKRFVASKLAGAAT